MKLSHRDKGSLTIEAALVIPIFTFAILTIILFMKIVYVQEIMQKAITDSANNIAQYAYLYDASGLMDISKEANKSVNEGAKLAEEHLGKFTEAMDAVSQINGGAEAIVQGDLSDIAAINNEIDRMLDNSELIVDNAEAIAIDVSEKDGFKREAVTFMCLAGKLLIDKGNETVTKLLTTMMLSNSLKTDTMSANERLKSLHVVQDLWSLDFRKSNIFMDPQSKEVDIIISYEVKIPMPFNFIPEFTINQRASSSAWLGAKKLNYGKDKN